MLEFTALQRERQKFPLLLPNKLKDFSNLEWVPLEGKGETKEEIEETFPHTFNLSKLRIESKRKEFHLPLRVGVVLSGGQAAGGHNVILGLLDALKKLHNDSKIYGFLNGPGGIIANDYIELTEEFIRPFRNQGGFDMIGAGRTKIETPEQFKNAAESVTSVSLDGLVIIGGDDSNTNAALLAEYFLAEGMSTRVIGVPKTIDGDLKNEEIEISFGFDSATKTYANLIGNILRDSLSAKKYYFFIKLMGRSASHIALECALQTHPNMTLIGEEIAFKKETLNEITMRICDLICQRSAQGKDFGTVLIPEGIIEFIPEFNQLIVELNRISVDPNTAKDDRRRYVGEKLSSEAARCFESIPREIQDQLLLDRDPHGNVQVSKIETERLFIEAVSSELEKRKKGGRYNGKFSPQPLFFGYEGRSCYPSGFDSTYCYALGHVAALLIEGGATGYMSCIQNLSLPVDDWTPVGVPLTSLIHLEERKGKIKSVIKKALVDLHDTPFAIFKEKRDCWRLEDAYRYPGPIQFFGPSEIVDEITLTLKYESQRPVTTP